ncbi:hypothetical protein C2S53_004064 [Perilla frutescens var. hirtella]|uniref:Uncharacterized protein n=1 Tax=Perilla frutescens var. hirtella TaxID=608512 RepID=A0AAD4IYU4_PERFH|nr:hypothetical protein C2S53_004064 [Perilla frutescens var. hirtella]
MRPGPPPALPCLDGLYLLHRQSPAVQLVESTQREQVSGHQAGGLGGSQPPIRIQIVSVEVNGGGGGAYGARVVIAGVVQRVKTGVQ